jgi:hypothetical protein
MLGRTIHGYWNLRREGEVGSIEEYSVLKCMGSLYICYHDLPTFLWIVFPSIAFSHDLIACLRVTLRLGLMSRDDSSNTHLSCGSLNAIKTLATLHHGCHVKRPASSALR